MKQEKEKATRQYPPSKHLNLLGMRAHINEKGLVVTFCHCNKSENHQHEEHVPSSLQCNTIRSLFGVEEREEKVI